MVDKKVWKMTKISPRLIKAGIAVILLIISFALYKNGLKRMQVAYEMNKNMVRDKFYQAAYDYAEAKHHVSNVITINVEDIKNICRLEVLSVSDTEFIIKNADDDSEIYSWLEVRGIGIFTIDLSVSEFITDAERQYVLVNIPKPALTECTVEATGKHFWKNNSIFNGSISDGIKLSQEQLSEGRLLLEESIKRNRRFYESAKKSAENMVEFRVRQWNPDLPDLQVEVNFIEVD